MNKRLKILKLILLTAIILVAISYLIQPSSPFYFFSRAVVGKLKSSEPKKEIAKIPITNFDAEKLNKYLIVEAGFLGVLDDMSLDFKDLYANKSIAINESRFWIPASTIKTFVLLELFRQKKLGLVSLDDNITINAQNVVPTEMESDEFPRLREGTVTTIKQLVESMIIESNNISYNTLLDVLDRRNINDTIGKLGFKDTVVGEKLNLDDNQLAQDALVPGRKPNTTTAADYTKLFELIYNKKVPGSDEMFAILKRQKSNDMLPVFLPRNIVVAHKTGIWEPRFHDGGIIYKPNDPFILSVFTDAGDPNVIAKLAQVAYFQDANLVGKPISSNNLINSKTQGFFRSDEKYYAEIPQKTNVLAAVTPEANIPLSVADLGITTKDLLSNKKVHGAFVTPGSILYPFKLLFENIALSQSPSAKSKVDIYLSLATNRLSEVKALMDKGDVKNAKIILDEGEKDLKQAVTFINKSNQKDLTELLRLRGLNNLYSSTLGDSAPQVSSFQKETFIDNTYDFYKKNVQEVKPVIRAAMPVALLQQQPIIGVVTEVKNGLATVKTDSGETKTIAVNSDVTRSRDFQSSTVDQITTITPGNKIAVVSPNGKEGTIIPLFILKNLPQELPKKSKGIILEIDPEKNLIKIQDNKGQTADVQIGPDTVIKAKDTNVTAGGIITGSSITVSGNAETVENQATPSATLSPQQISITQSLSPFPTNIKTTRTPVVSIPVKAITAPIGNKPSIPPKITIIKATTITVIKNDSGKKEKVQEKNKQAPTPKRKSWLNIFYFLLTYLHNEG